MSTRKTIGSRTRSVRHATAVRSGTETSGSTIHTMAANSLKKLQAARQQRLRSGTRKNSGGCEIHPRYKAFSKPRCDCFGCWRFFLGTLSKRRDLSERQIWERHTRIDGCRGRYRVSFVCGVQSFDVTPYALETKTHARWFRKILFKALLNFYDQVPV